MASIQGKTALVTGASSGIGASAVELLLAQGATVYAAARRTEKMQDLKTKGAKIISLDITQESSIVTAVRQIEDEQGSVDILINNAGYGSYGAIEDVPMDEARRQFDVNIFGLARLTQLVLPKMRSNRYGKIVNISSVGGKIYTPFGGWYHATKHALEGMTDALRLEVKKFGIDAVIVEPGGIATEWGAISAKNLIKTSGSGAYAEQARKTAERIDQMYASGKLSDPGVIGRIIVKAVTASRPRTRYAAGAMSGLVLFLRRWLSDRAFDRLVESMA
ncbi:MAG: oxidoreductase [Spirochaetaceae bacterium]|nr:oxidoreductase [Spirochaetaceae bacterium]MDT8297464.1 oxidoreductase [Spirochaetaceae bacterium]